MSYRAIERGAGGRQGQLLRHETDPERWMVKVYVSRDAKGRKKYRAKVVHGRKRDAEAALMEMLQAKNRGQIAAHTRQTLNELCCSWLDHKTHDVTPRTVESYRRALDAYALPVLGHRKVQDLTLFDFEQLYADMRAGSLPLPVSRSTGWRGKPLGARTVRLVHDALHQALSQAVRWGLIVHNPLAEARVPKGKPKERRALSVAERQRFIEASADSFYRLLYLVLMETGLRPGEACALQWRDVDLERGRLTVARAVTKGQGGTRVVSHTKTSKSRRTVPCSHLVDELRRHQVWQVEHGLSDAGLVFTNQEGGMLAPWTFNRRDLERILKAAGIAGPFSLYNFRHTFATLHLQSTTHLKTVSEWLGHSSIMQTANTYQHLSADVADEHHKRYVAYIERATAAVRGNDQAN